jgi:hypothetical protein
LCLVLLFAACRGDGGRTFEDVGDPCTGARDCDTGLCVDLDAEGTRICTFECRDDDACPEGFSCERFSLAEEGDAGPIGEAVRACAPITD